MPRNSSGVYSKPAGTTPSVGQVIDPVPWNALTTDLGNEITNSLPRDGSAPMTAPLKNADGTQALPSVTFSSDITTGMYRKAAGVIALVSGGSEILNLSGSGIDVNGVISGRIDYVEKSGNYTALAADAGSTLRFTAAATLSLTAAATLAAGWSVSVFSYGGDVSVAPNGTETINGIATPLVVKQGRTVTLYSDGVGFFVSVPGAWETIGENSASAAAAVTVTNLSAFKRLRITGYMQPATAAQLLLRTSVNNGSSFDQNNGDYTWYAVYGNGTAAASVNGTSTAVGVGAGGTTNNADLTGGIQFEITMENFNKGRSTKGLITFGNIAGSNNFAVGTIQFLRNGIIARNAFQLITAGAVNAFWEVLVEGVRG
ncbi:hypothetical protein GFM14_02835 [Rhizobium leguminosarum bv. viciae]|uniref:hypothetical protein n=1 Tax=Rhizobium leguminosarum TaxID=384 RepID=UPI0014414A81|nr:hypothetical protein [Rhizobium leguminosarum]NKJ90553.1 hypothetical protein [Rhizobium leguminosarum bv. viciae]